MRIEKAKLKKEEVDFIRAWCSLQGIKEGYIGRGEMDWIFLPDHSYFWFPGKFKGFKGHQQYDLRDILGGKNV